MQQEHAYVVEDTPHANNTKSYERAMIAKGKHSYRVIAQLMAEDALGRPLRKDEVLFHLNGDSMDYAPENLLLTTRRQVGRYNRTGRLPYGSTLAELRPDWVE